MQSESAKYGSVAIALHWWVFVLVIVVGILGLLHDSWPDATQAFWINIHALCGLLLWLTVIARILWRRANPPPALPPEVDVLTRRFSGPVHRALYALLLIIPVIGIVTFVWHGRVFDFGLFRVNFGVHKNRAIFHPAEDIHGYLAYALFAIAMLHALASLWHHFIRKDGVLLRMWP